MAALQLKRGTAAKWLEIDPVLAAGEPGVELETGRKKIGDGVHHWSELEYDDEKAVYTAPTSDNFPKVGCSNRIYKAYNEKKLYQWNDELKKYEKLETSSGSDITNITLISGGNANG